MRMIARSGFIAYVVYQKPKQKSPVNGRGPNGRIKYANSTSWLLFCQLMRVSGSALARSNNNLNRNTVDSLCQVALYSSWVIKILLRIIDKRHQHFTIWMDAVSLRVNNKLVADIFSLCQPQPGHLDFDKHLLMFEQKVNAGSSSGVTWCPFLITNIIKKHSQ